MLNIASSASQDPSPCFLQSKRKGKEDNLAWLERHVTQLAKRSDSKGKSFLILLGGRAKADFRMRVAQGHVRHDMSPSHWSHVVLLGASGWTAAGSIHEISIEPRDGFRFPPSDNGVQQGKLSHYKSAFQFPNVAVIRLPVPLSAMRRSLKAFKRQRRVLDAVELILVWLAYVWGVGRSGNPLLDGHGIPSAAFIEILAGAEGLDLTPGLDSRASCPEAIWQAARYWHDYYGEGAGKKEDRRLHGFWHLEHFLGE